MQIVLVLCGLGGGDGVLLARGRPETKLCVESKAKHQRRQVYCEPPFFFPHVTAGQTQAIILLIAT